jgi:hypothetical protein
VLNKNASIAGAKIVTKAVLRDGLPASYGGNEVIDAIRAWPQAGGVMVSTTPVFTVGPNEPLEIVEGPKKNNRINMCKVRNQHGQVGHVFWCELRASSSHA